jgi:hypothetical protein
VVIRLVSLAQHNQGATAFLLDVLKPYFLLGVLLVKSVLSSTPTCNFPSLLFLVSYPFSFKGEPSAEYVSVPIFADP